MILCLACIKVLRVYIRTGVELPVWKNTYFCTQEKVSDDFTLTPSQIVKTLYPSCFQL